MCVCTYLNRHKKSKVFGVTLQNIARVLIALYTIFHIWFPSNMHHIKFAKEAINCNLPHFLAAGHSTEIDVYTVVHHSPITIYSRLMQVLTNFNEKIRWFSCQSQLNIGLMLAYDINFSREQSLTKRFNESVWRIQNLFISTQN